MIMPPGCRTRDDSGALGDSVWRFARERSGERAAGSRRPARCGPVIALWPVYIGSEFHHGLNQPESFVRRMERETRLGTRWRQLDRVENSSRNSSLSGFTEDRVSPK